MHVLSVIHYPTYGGPHNRNASVIPILRKQGIETTVLLPEEEGNASALLRARGVAVVQAPLGRLRAVRDPQTHLRLVGQFRRDVARLRGVIRTLDVDLVLVNGLANPHSALAAHLEGVPVVWQLLDTLVPNKLRTAMMGLVRAMADAIMSTGRTVADAHRGAKAFGERLVLFFPAADPALFINDGGARSEARSRLGLPSDCCVVGNVGNINPMKGHDVFVEAAAIGHKRRPGTRFAILGAQYPHHARYAENLWREASSRGLELGKDLIVVDPGTDVASLAPAFDVFWLTSKARSEGIPTVVGEAMALELPVVASRVGSVHEAVVDGVTGRLVPPRDPSAFVEATLPYLDDDRLRTAVGRAARARAQELYSPEVCADRHLLAFELATEHRRRRGNHDRLTAVRRSRTHPPAS
jgi:glycosyltransferase involved in cell wall biosynthesis